MIDILLQEFIADVITEGIHEAETTRLSRACVNNLKDFIKKSQNKIYKKDFQINVFQKIFEDFVNVKKQKHYFCLEVIVTDGNECTISGNVKETATTVFLITVNISIPRSFIENFQLVLSELLFELKDIIRHEIEHVQQGIENRTPIIRIGINEKETNEFKKFDSWVSYILQPHELEAWAVGLYKKAKMKHTGFDAEVENLLKFMSRNVPDHYAADNVSLVKTALKSYAKKRFPNVKW